MNENETMKNDDHTEVHEEPRTMSDDEVHFQIQTTITRGWI
jgi:hypothetical protein